MDINVDPELVSYILSAVLGIFALFLGDRWRKIKDKFAEGQLLTMKFAIAIQELSKAIEDDKITQEEAEDIVNSWKEIIDDAGLIIRTK